VTIHEPVTTNDPVTIHGDRSLNRYQPPTPAAATWLVADREIRMRLRSKSFLISTGILMLVVLASVVIGGVIGAHPPLTKVAAVGSAIALVQKSDAFDVTTVATVAKAKALVRSHDVDAAVVPDATAASPTGITVIGFDSAPTDVVDALSIPPRVEVLQRATQNPLLVYFVALGFGLLFFMSAITFGQTIAQSVVEEKQTRVVEILLSTLPARVLLAGKIVGNSILAFAQIIAIVLLAGIGMLVSGQNILLADVGPSLIWFAVFFAAGFVMLAALFSATAALVSRQEDVASAISPVTMLVMIPYFLVIVFNNDPVVLAVMSYVPFSAPVGMPMRVFLGTASWWEPVLSLAILLATTVITVIVGARVYSNGLLRMGSRVKLSEALAREVQH
jgi:ABC-2 type transport system permease protein